MIEMDNMLNNIILNLADSYPQAPAAGGTPRMKETITEVNRVDNHENDLIYTSGIKISEFLKLKKDKYGTEKCELAAEGDYT
jgi:hypothetical protein